MRALINEQQIEKPLLLMKCYKYISRQVELIIIIFYYFCGFLRDAINVVVVVVVSIYDSVAPQPRSESNDELKKSRMTIMIRIYLSAAVIGSVRFIPYTQCSDCALSILRPIKIGMQNGTCSRCAAPETLTNRKSNERWPISIN